MSCAIIIITACFLEFFPAQMLVDFPSSGEDGQREPHSLLVSKMTESQQFPVLASSGHFRRCRCLRDAGHFRRVAFLGSGAELSGTEILSV